MYTENSFYAHRELGWKKMCVKLFEFIAVKCGNISEKFAGEKNFQHLTVYREIHLKSRETKYRVSWQRFDKA